MIRIYGCSDDLIEIEGDIREEFYVSTSNIGYIATSNGTLIKYIYDGDWTFVVERFGNLSCGDSIPVDTHSLFHRIGLEDYPEYSDIVDINDDTIQWIAHVKEIVRRKAK